MSAVIGAFLGGWALLSILVQLPVLHRVTRWVYARDYFGLIPSWSFFAHPGGHCLYLWYQDTLLSGQLTHWKRVMFCNPLPIRVLWNPRKCYWKMLEQACCALLEMEAQKSAEQQWEKNLSYQLTLTSVLAQPHENGSTHRQFMIACVLPGQKADKIFLSRKHSFAETEIFEDFDL